MESIRENRPLMISLVGTYSFIVFLALGWSSDLCEQFGIVQFPEEVCIKTTTLEIILNNNLGYTDISRLVNQKLILRYTFILTV